MTLRPKIFQLCAFSVLILLPVGLWHLFRFIEFYIAFLKGNIIFFQTVRIVCLPILQGFFSDFVVFTLLFHFLLIFKHISYSENCFTAKIYTCSSISGIFVIHNNLSYINLNTVIQLK